MIRKTQVLALGFVLTAASAAWEARAISPGYAPPWPDFAEFEHSGGCRALRLQADKPEALSDWTQEKLDELYACSTAGPMPDGYMKGSILVAKDGNVEGAAKYANSIGLPLAPGLVKTLGELLWNGKRFYAKDHAQINLLGPHVASFLGFDLAGQQRFPAHVYCGQSLLDSRRESLVIDYAFSEGVVIDGKKPFNPTIDWIFAARSGDSKRGLSVRDELRMIHPGFYLGRVYSNMMFAFNVILTAEHPVAGVDQCFAGYTAGA